MTAWTAEFFAAMAAEAPACSGGLFCLYCSWPERQARRRPEAGPGHDQKISSKFVMQCLNAQTLGDGMLYSEIHRGQFVFNKTTGEWLRWQGHHWEVDVMNRAVSAVEAVALRYGEEIELIRDKQADAQKKADKEEIAKLEKQSKRLWERIKSLRRKNGRTSCLEFVHTGPPETSLAIEGTELDADQWLLGLQNGVLDLRTGEMRPGRYKDWISKACRVEWAGLAATCPEWEKYLWESIEHEATIEFLRRWCGYCLTGETSEQKFLMLSGAGRNGKGMFIETLLDLMGAYSGPIQAEMLLDQGRSRSSSGPSPDIMSLMGRRLATASESDENRRFSASKLKWFTGSDTLVGRNPHDKRDTTFHPTHKLMLMTNNDPYAPADDFAFWDRILKVDWPFKFVHNPRQPDEKQRDDQLPKKLAEELPGILAWCVRGCMEWQHEGLNPPGCVTESVSQYQREQDTVQDFIDACLYVDLESKTLRTSGGDLYARFKEWFCEYHNSRVPSITWFGRRMGKKFEKTKDGVVMYLGVGILVEGQTI